jgi:hypothetical protein
MKTFYLVWVLLVWLNPNRINWLALRLGGSKWLENKDIIKGFSILCPPQLLRLNLAFLPK